MQPLTLNMFRFMVAALKDLPYESSRNENATAKQMTAAVQTLAVFDRQVK